ncbi:MAG: plasmid recombination protein [Enterococcus sp.]|nr:plasmid recombination protein [Enterococcus sp.]
MAHMEKFGKAAAANMIHHYERDRTATLLRENINIELTRENYDLGEMRGYDYIRDRIAEVEEEQGRAVRKDANVLCDWVITAPKELPREECREFFENCREFIADRYGEDNIVGAWVHMDESRPHMHCGIVPVVEREDGRHSLSAKDMFDRQDLRSFHTDLQEHLRDRAPDRAGAPRVLLHDRDILERAASRVEGGTAEYKRARDAVRQLRQEESRTRERLERLRSRESDLRSRLPEKRERNKIVDRFRDGLREAHERLREHAERLRELVRDRGVSGGRGDFREPCRPFPDAGYERGADRGMDIGDDRGR